MKRFSLAARHPAASEPYAATARAGEAVDGCPADTAGIANPSLAIGGDAGKKGQLAEAAVGLRPIAMAVLLESAQVKRGAYRIDAIGIAVGVHTCHQISAARAVRERRHLRLGLAGQRHSKAQKQVLQPIVHWEFPRSVLRQITNSPVSD
jgi:hypothetical protein